MRPLLICATDVSNCVTLTGPMHRVCKCLCWVCVRREHICDEADEVTGFLYSARVEDCALSWCYALLWGVGVFVLDFDATFKFVHLLLLLLHRWEKKRRKSVFSGVKVIC